jgi:hypothetical protein
MRCSVLLASYVAVRPLGIILEDDQLARSLKRSIRFYCGYATLTHAPSAFEILLQDAEAARIAAERQQIDLLGIGGVLTPWERAALPKVPLYAPRGVDVHSPVDASNGFIGDQDFDLTPSEYALIWPLFELYVELENAEALEASRASGMDGWGRSTDTIRAEIEQTEERMSKAAFEFECITL